MTDQAREWKPGDIAIVSRGWREGVRVKLRERDKYDRDLWECLVFSSPVIDGISEDGSVLYLTEAMFRRLTSSDIPTLADRQSHLRDQQAQFQREPSPFVAEREAREAESQSEAERQRLLDELAALDQELNTKYGSVGVSTRGSGLANGIDMVWKAIIDGRYHATLKQLADIGEGQTMTIKVEPPGVRYDAREPEAVEMRGADTDIAVAESRLLITDGRSYDAYPWLFCESNLIRKLTDLLEYMTNIVEDKP